MSDSSVIVVGTGWAGLAAAVTLHQQGQRVLLLESARQPGGRARSASFNDLAIDNGQHILIGAYHDTLKLMQQCGVKLDQVLQRVPLNLRVDDDNGDYLHLQGPELPAPLHILVGLLRCKGLGWKERLAAIRFGLYCQMLGYELNKDISVSQLMQNAAQPEKVVRLLWEPICIATLNTPMEKASASLFLRVFRDAFTRRRQDAEMLLPTVALGELFPEPACQFLQQQGHQVRLSSRVKKLLIADGKIRGVQLENETLHSEQVILACAPQHVPALIEGHAQLQDTAEMLQQLTYQPICTVYLQYPETVRLPQALTGMTGTISQWVMDRGQLCHQPGLLSVVISAEGPHMEMDNATLCTTVHQELVSRFSVPSLLNSMLIREKRATFSSDTGIATIRPHNTTAVKGLYLAGDYTSTGYPATLEGAVRSGIRAATEINSSNPEP